MDCSKAVEILPLTRDSRQQREPGSDSSLCPLCLCGEGFSPQRHREHREKLRLKPPRWDPFPFDDRELREELDHFAAVVVRFLVGLTQHFYLLMILCC